MPNYFKHVNRLKQHHQSTEPYSSQHFRSFTDLIVGFWLRNTKRENQEIKGLWVKDITNIIICYLINLLFYGNNCIIINDFNEFIIIGTNNSGCVVLQSFNQNYFKQNKVTKITISLKEIKYEQPKYKSMLDIGYDIKYLDFNDYGSKTGTMRVTCCLNKEQEYVKIIEDDSDKDSILSGKINQLVISFTNKLETTLNVKSINNQSFFCSKAMHYQSVKFFIKFQSCKNIKFTFNTDIV